VFVLVVGGGGGGGDINVIGMCLQWLLNLVLFIYGTPVLFLLSCNLMEFGISHEFWCMLTTALICDKSNPHLIHEYWGEYLYSHLNVQKYIYMYKHEESWSLDGEQNYLVGFYSLSISTWTIPTERGECVNNLNLNQVAIFWALTLQSKILLDGGRLTLNH